MIDGFRPDDFETPLWRRIEQRLQADLTAARRELESAALDDKPLGSARLRARISVYQKYLGLPEEVQAAITRANSPTSNDGGDY